MSDVLVVRIGVVEPDPSLQLFVWRIARDGAPGARISCGHTIGEVSSDGELDLLIYDTGTGIGEIEEWRAAIL